MPAAATTPIVKSITVDCSRERAFEVFTRDIGTWWPLDSHSVGESSAVSVEMECRLGGRIVERFATDAPELSSAAWGDVLAWEPPERLVFSWYPEHEGETPTEIEVSFTSLAPDLTRVELKHRGWERLTPERLQTRDNYQRGWDRVLGAYASTAAR